MQGPVLRPFLLGDDPYAAGPAPRHRHRRPGGHAGARACGRGRLLRRHRPRRGPDASRSRRRTATRSRCCISARSSCGVARRSRRARRRDGRPERRGRVARALRLSRRATSGGAERVPGSAAFPAARQRLPPGAPPATGAQPARCRFRARRPAACRVRRSRLPAPTLRAGAGRPRGEDGHRPRSFARASLGHALPTPFARRRAGGRPSSRRAPAAAASASALDSGRARGARRRRVPRSARPARTTRNQARPRPRAARTRRPPAPVAATRVRGPGVDLRRRRCGGGPERSRDALRLPGQRRPAAAFGPRRRVVLALCAALAPPRRGCDCRAASRGAARIIDADALLPDDTDLLRQLRRLTSATRTRRSRPTRSCATIASAATRRSSSRARTRTRPRSYRVAEEQGLDPKTYVDDIVEHWRELPRRVEPTYDFFIRTTDEGHKRFVQEFLQRIYDNGRHLRGRLLGPVLRRRARSSRARPSSSTGCAPSTGRHPSGSRRRTTSSASPPTRTGCSSSTTSGPTSCCRASATTRRAASSRAGCEDFSVSRAGQPWGIPIPWDAEQVVYVWVDALINYLSALTYARDGRGPARAVLARTLHHLLGKDILRFHCVFWPALLLAAGYEVPQQLFVHGFLLLDDRKISKSLGNVIDPLDLVDVYGADAVRFWALRSVSFGQDGNASLDSLHERYERELANDLGNLRLAHDGDDRALPRRADRAAASGTTSSPPCSTRCARSSSSASTRTTSPARSKTIWEVVRWLNRYVEATRAVAAREGRGARGRARPGALRPRGRPARGCGRARAPTCRRPRRTILAALRPAGRARLERGRGRAAPADRRNRGRGAALPARRPADRRGVIDTHAHLDACAEPATRSSRARARRPGSSGSSRSGPDSTPAARRSRSPREREGVFAALGIHPHQAAEPDAGRLDELRELLARTSAPSPSGRPGSTSTATTRRATASASSSSGSSRSRPSSARRSSSTRARPRTRRSRRSRASTGTVVLHCFSAPELLPGRARARLLRLVRRQRHLPERRGAARGGAPGSRPTACSPRRTARTSRRSRGAGARTSRRTSSTRSRCSPRRAARTRRARRPARRQRHRRLLAVMSRPRREEGARPALPRRREPARRDRAARRARARGRRARGRPGPRRPHRATSPTASRHVHAVELDRSLEAAAARGLAGRDERRASLRRRAPARSRRARAGADEARLEPAVQHRHAARGREPRRPAEPRRSGR